MKVAEIGEHKLLKIIQKYCPSDVVGDDAAVLTTTPDRSLVVTTDVLINNVHFSNITTTPFDSGWRAAAANLSDLAAMGASPLGITVGLGIPGDLEVSWVENLYQGMTACLQQYHTPIVGGDVVRSPVISLAITAFGQVYPQQVIRRDRARVGDAIVATGIHGASRGGLELLLNPEMGNHLTSTDKQSLIASHQRPQPRLDVLPHLREIFAPESQFSVAGMDSSDGLADAVQQICSQSGVGAVIERQNIPLPPAFPNWLSEEKIWEYVLYGGEDFQLVLCLSPKLAYELVQRLDQDAAIIGTITDGSTVILRHTQRDKPEGLHSTNQSQQKYPDQVLTLDQGFQHF
ncbi:thiamine-phosphate kinase [Calothrix rhizosoleniae]|uniref:thiamine-phosphate kinase n=1 Tax=Calothrix rhizosoleniae TaxID=888997 RepID=UPI000B4A23A5|nr:thiamine-phosphate kinase [Calothrix rhizosoleniae]